jgi:hypothetical protein
MNTTNDNKMIQNSDDTDSLSFTVKIIEKTENVLVHNPVDNDPQKQPLIRLVILDLIYQRLPFTFSNVDHHIVVTRRNHQNQKARHVS